MFLHHKNYSKLIFAGLIGFFIIFFIGLLIIISGDNYGGNYKNHDISKYRNFDDVPRGDNFPSINFFPENIENVETINNYYHFANLLSFSGYESFWEVVLDVTYNKENFYLELERLSTNYNENKLKFDNNNFLFNFPTYIAYYISENSNKQEYGYVSIDESNLKIIYVYINCPYRGKNKDYKDFIKLSVEYLPKNFFKNMNSNTVDGYYFHSFFKKEIWYD